MGHIKIDELSTSLKEYIANLGLTEEQVNELIQNVTGDMSTLQTTEKTVAGAINELFQSANNGKELIATAIGEPLNSSDTFSAMSNDINGLTSNFKAALMNNGVSVEPTDKFKQLIEKIASLSDSEGKGIKYAEGNVNLNLVISDNFNNYIVFDTEFKPTVGFIEILGFTADQNIVSYSTGLLGSNLNTSEETEIQTAFSVGTVLNNYTSKFFSYMNITDNGLKLYHRLYKTGGNLSKPVAQLKWYAIGVGEEDTTLLDSLKSILQDEGVIVTEEDDMASLIVKTDNEFDNKNNEIASNKQALANALKSNGRDLTGNESIDELISLVKIKGILTSDKDIKSIYTSYAGTNSFILKNDGNVWSTGSNNVGQLGLGHLKNVNLFTFVSTNNVKNIYLGPNHTFIIKNDGTVWGTGHNGYGQLGLNSDSNMRNLTKVDISNVKEICCGGNHTMLLKNDGTVWGCGYNGQGQLGFTDTSNKKIFTQVNIDNVKKISCGLNYTFLVKNDGTLWSTGHNNYGQLGFNNTTNKSTFTQVDITDVKSVYCGMEYTFILKNDGTVWSCGFSAGQLGLGDNVSHYSFNQVNISNVKEIACGRNHTLVLKNDGTVWSCGDNSKGQLGLGNQNNKNTFNQVPITDVKQIACGMQHSLILKTDGSAWSCGSQGGQTGVPVGDADIITTFTQTYKTVVTEVTFD